MSIAKLDTTTVRGTAFNACVNVRAEAARRGMSQSGLGRALSMTPNQISRRWRGQLAWGLEELDQVAKILHVSVEDLLARSEGFEPPTFWLGVWATLERVLRFRSGKRAFESGNAGVSTLETGVVSPVHEHRSTF